MFSGLPIHLSKFLDFNSIPFALKRSSCPLRAQREQASRDPPAPRPASAAAAVGRTGPHVACTARQIPCQIANKIYRGFSCFYRDFPSLSDLLPPFSEESREGLVRRAATRPCFQVHLSTSPYGVLVGLRLASTSITYFLQVP